MRGLDGVIEHALVYIGLRQAAHLLPSWVVLVVAVVAGWLLWRRGRRG